MKKRILSLALVLSIVTSLITALPVTASATSGTCGENLTWTLSGDTLEIKGTGPMDDYSMPWKHLDLEIEKVIIEKGITTIGACAFRDMGIRKIVIPEGVTHIGESAFMDCGLLADAALPSTLIEIGRSAFYDTAISVVNIPDGVKYINDSTFKYCKNITELTIPDSVTVIGRSAFFNTYNLKKVYLSDNITDIQYDAFGTLSIDMNEPAKQRVLDVYAPEGSVAYNWAKSQEYNNAYASTRGEYILKFSQNKPSDWAVEEVINAINENLTTDKVTTDYQKDITREEFCELVVKLYEKLANQNAETGNDVFIDTDNLEILKAYSLGIVKGVSNDRFAPNDKITRQELCVMLTRSIDVAIDGADITSFEINHFTDENNIADWAIDSVNYAYTKGIIKGIGDNKVDPLGNTTREQAVLMILRGFNNHKDLIPERPYDDVENIIDFNDEASIFTENTAQKINKSIQSIHTTEDGYVMVISDNTEFDSLKKDDVFFLEGGDGTPFGEPFIGKIGHITDNGNSLSVNLVEPEINEVFDELSINMSEEIDINDLENVHLVEGLTSSIESVEQNSEGELTLLSNETSSIERAAFSDFSDTTDGGELSITGTIDLLKLFNLKERTPITPTVYWLKDGEAYHLSHCQYIRNKMPECYSCYITDVSHKDPAPPKTACRKCLPDYKPDEPENENFKVSENLTLDLSLSLKDIYPNFIFEYDENGIKTLSGEVSGDVEFKTVLNTEIGGKIEKITTERRILGNNLKVTGLQEKTMPFFYAAYSPTSSFSWGIGDGDKKKFEGYKELNPITIAIVAYVDLNGNISISGSAEFSYKRHVEFSTKIVDNYELCFSPDFEMSEGEWSLPINVSAKGDLNIEEAISVMIYIFNINIVEMAIVKLEQNATGNASLSCRYGSSGSLPAKFTVDGYMECLYKLFELSLKLKLKYDLLFVNGEVGFSYNSTAYTKKVFEIGVQNDITYDKEVMGVDSCTAYDENYYYFKDKNGNMVRKSKTDYGDVELIYVDDFYSFCAIDKSYLYILKKNGDKYYLSRIAKNNLVERQLLDNVSAVFFQDEQYIYFVDNFSKNTIQKLNRKDLTISDYATFDDNDDEIIWVSQYSLPEYNQYYVVTYKRDMISDLFRDYHNNCYVINKQGEILKDFGEVDDLEECYTVHYDDYIVASNIRGNSLINWYAQYVSLIFGTYENSKQVGTIGGWHYDDGGICVINKNETGEAEFVLKIHTPDGEEKTVMPIHSDQIFKTIHRTTITDYDEGKKTDKEIVYCVDEVDDTWVLYEISNNYNDYKKVTTIPTGASLSNCHICILDDTLYIYSVDEKDKESVLIDTYEY